MIPLAAAEDVIDASGVAPRIEHMLPSGARGRQLAVRTLLAGMMITLGDSRPAHLTRVHQALAGLPEGEQRRLGVLADWKNGPHLLTYRQAEYTFGLIARVLGKDEPDGQPLPELQRICDDLLEASVPAEFKNASASLAVDWSDLASFSRPPPRGTSDCADPEASWGHRRNNLLHDEDELFFGYYLSDAVTVPDEHGPPVPEFARRMTVSSCRHDPVPAFTPVLTAMPEDGIPLGAILSDSGYSHRIPQNWASPLRKAGAALVQDLHPHDRGPRGTHQGAVVANGSLYCPCTPRTLLELAPLSHAADPAQAAAHDAKTAEAARYKLGRLTSDDSDGCHRVQCPAAAGKIRCPLRPVVRLQLGHQLGPAMMGHRAGSSDLQVRCRGAVLAGAVGSVVGVEGHRDSGPAPGGRRAAPGEPQAAARVDRSGHARGVVPDAAEGLALAPGRDPWNVAALAPPHGDQEVDPAPVTGTATAREGTRRVDRPARQREPGLGCCPHPGRAAPPGTPDRRGHDPQDPAPPADPATVRTR
jgi:hypothetical protein